MTTREEADRKLLRYLCIDQLNPSGTTQESSLGQAKFKVYKSHPFLNLDNICDFFRDKVVPNTYKELSEESVIPPSTKGSTPDSLVALSCLTALSESAAFSTAKPNTHSSEPSFKQAQKATTISQSGYNLEQPTTNQHLISEEFIPGSALSRHQITFHSGFGTFNAPACSFISPVPANQLFPLTPHSETTAVPQTCYISCDSFNSVCNCSRASLNQVAPLAPAAPAEIIPISYLSGASGGPYTPTETQTQRTVSNNTLYKASSETVNLTQHNLPASQSVFVFPHALSNTDQSQNQAYIPIFVVPRPLETASPLVSQ